MPPTRVPRNPTRRTSFNRITDRTPPRERPNRDLASAGGDTPAVTQGKSQRQLEVTTYFTKPGGTRMINSGDRMWAIIRLTLETAGPVAVGQRQNLEPVLGGTGALLRTGVERSFTLSRGDRLYIASTSINRVQVVVEAAPWLEQIAGTINTVTQNQIAATERLVAAVQYKR